MDLSFDDADAGLPGGGREFLAANTDPFPTMSYDTAEGFEQHGVGRGALRRRSVGGHLAGELRRPRRLPAAVGDLRGGVLPRRCARAGERQRHFLLAPTLFEHGTPKQQDRLLPTMASGEQIWAQAWSEPEAGSDLASLRSTATKTDGGWLLNGQKIWCSRAPFGDWGFGLFRSDPEAERHRGLTYFMFDLEGRRHHRAPDRAARRRDRLRRDLLRRRVRARRRRHRRRCTTAGAWR